MQFKVRKIKQKKSGNIFNKLFGKKTKFLVIFFVSISIIFFAASKFFTSEFFLNQTKRLFSIIDIKKDKFGHTNILLLGVAGKNEEGGNLSDSILIASINPKTPSVSFLSLPRDLFISSGVKKIGDRKLNEIYAASRWLHHKNSDEGDQAGLKIVESSISKFTGIDIHYGVVVNFKIFEDFIDTLGGIQIFVPKAIHDPYYPDNNYGYQTFTVRKGIQNFDGATALKYARSRKTSSDYDRAKRQQALILAIKEKAVSLNLLTDFDKLKSFWDLFRKHINTDLGIKDIIALAKIGIGINYEDTISVVLNDDPMQQGGYLYTPAKEFYEGQFVLLPKNLKETQLFMSLVLIKPEILIENSQIAILNGSKIQGKASEVSARLRKLGLHVIETDNYESDKPIVNNFLIDVSGKKTETLNFLKKLFKAEKIEKQLETDPHNLIDIKLVIGTN